jgi:hypothetical protein
MPLPRFLKSQYEGLIGLITTTPSVLKAALLKTTGYSAAANSNGNSHPDLRSDSMGVRSKSFSKPRVESGSEDNVEKDETYVASSRHGGNQ